MQKPTFFTSKTKSHVCTILFDRSKSGSISGNATDAHFFNGNILQSYRKNIFFHRSGTFSIIKLKDNGPSLGKVMSVIMGMRKGGKEEEGCVEGKIRKSPLLPFWPTLGGIKLLV